jgi:hypothetical protein
MNSSSQWAGRGLENSRGGLPEKRIERPADILRDARWEYQLGISVTLEFLSPGWLIGDGTFR